MNCATARALLLEADRLDLRGEGGTELSRHLRECAPCRAAAEAIVRAEAMLKRRLDASRPTRTVEQIVRVAEARRRGARARRAWRVLPLAAAAGLAAILLVRRPPALPSLAPPVAQPRLSVTAPPGRNVAVLQTDNPDVVVYWFF